MEPKPKLETAALPTPALLDVAALAAKLNVGRRTIWRYADAGRIGRLRRWRIADIDRWIADGCPSCRSAGVGANRR